VIRTRAAIAVVAVTSSALSFACSDDKVANFADAGRESSSSDAGDDVPEDGGGLAPSGCVLKTTGFKSGKKAENVPRSDATGTASWTNLTGALAVDGDFATVTLAEGQESASLRVSDFGFAIPDGAETWGIEVELKRQAPGGGAADARIDVDIANKQTHYKVVETPWPTSIVGTHDYGQAVDTWGADVEPPDFDNAAFAARVAVKRTAGATGPVTANVESIRVAIHYCPLPVKK
jgi:hypothetical protein